MLLSEQKLYRFAANERNMFIIAKNEKEAWDLLVEALKVERRSLRNWVLVKVSPEVGDGVFFM